MFDGTAHVVLGSGLTIAGATFCLSFTRLPYFQTLGVPLAIGIIVVVVTGLTLALVGLVTLPGYQTNYNDRSNMPADLPAVTARTEVQRLVALRRRQSSFRLQ